MQPAEIFWRMLQYNEFDMSEMSLSNYCNPGEPGRGRPMWRSRPFPSRVFRHGLFLHQTPPRESTSRPNLAGKIGGVPEIQPDGLGLYARHPAARIRRASEPDPLGCRAAPIVSSTRCRPTSVSPQAPPGTELGDLLETAASSTS